MNESEPTSPVFEEFHSLMTNAIEQWQEYGSEINSRERFDLIYSSFTPFCHHARQLMDAVTGHQHRSPHTLRQLYTLLRSAQTALDPNNFVCVGNFCDTPAEALTSLIHLDVSRVRSLINMRIDLLLSSFSDLSIDESPHPSSS